MLGNTRNAVLVAFTFAAIAGFAIAGHYLYKLPIGLDQSAFLLGDAVYGVVEQFAPNTNGAFAGAVWLVVALLAIATISFFIARGPMRASRQPDDSGRRRFLLGAGPWLVGFGSLVTAVLGGVARGFLGLGTGGGGWKVTADALSPPVPETHPEWKTAWKGSRVKDYRRLGRTDWKVSDIVLGTGPISGDKGEEIVREGIGRGINYVDTSPDYSAAGSENAVGKAIKGSRDKLFLATKFCTPTGHLPPGTPVARYKHVVEESLQRLGTDYVDLCHIHSCDEVDRLMDPNVHEAFDRLKEEGKVRFLGFSTHTPRLEQVASAGVDSGRFDVMMLAYHHGAWPKMQEIIERAHREQDMGVVAMKTLKGAKHHGLVGFREEEDAYAQAALKWVLSNEQVSCAVISFYEMQHVDEYLYVSGGRPTARDVAILQRYDRLTAGTYCAPHCDACLGSCPEGLAINDVLRHRMYFEDYGWEKEGMRLYSKLEKSASVCASCSAPCLGSCPLGIPIQERTTGAHELLTLG